LAQEIGKQSTQVNNHNTKTPPGELQKNKY